LAHRGVDVCLAQLLAHTPGVQAVLESSGIIAALTARLVMWIRGVDAQLPAGVVPMKMTGRSDDAPLAIKLFAALGDADPSKFARRMYAWCHTYLEPARRSLVHHMDSQEDVAEFGSAFEQELMSHSTHRPGLLSGTLTQSGFVFASPTDVSALLYGDDVSEVVTRCIASRLLQADYDAAHRAIHPLHCLFNVCMTSRKCVLPCP